MKGTLRTVILAAGQGSRLLPITKCLPKCLIKINERTIIEHQLSALKKHGLEDIIVVIGHHGDKIKKLLGSKVKYIENVEYKSTNSSYSLWLARNYLKEGFVYLNSDLIFCSNMLQGLLNSKYNNAIVVNRSNVSAKTDMFKAIMKNNRIQVMAKNLKQNDICAEVIGPAKFDNNGSNKVFQLIENLLESGNKNEWCYAIFSKMAQELPFYGVEVNNPVWFEIDTSNDIERAKDGCL